MKEFFLSLLMLLSPVQKGEAPDVAHNLQANFFQDLWQEFVGKVWEEKKDFWLTLRDFHLPAETENGFRAVHSQWEHDSDFLIQLAKSSGQNYDLYTETLKRSFDLLQLGKENEEKTSILEQLTGTLDAVCEVCNLQAVNRQGAQEQCLRICR